jgi:hypothetical protein
MSIPIKFICVSNFSILNYSNQEYNFIKNAQYYLEYWSLASKFYAFREHGRGSVIIGITDVETHFKILSEMREERINKILN